MAFPTEKNIFQYKFWIKIDFFCVCKRIRTKLVEKNKTKLEIAFDRPFLREITLNNRWFFENIHFFLEYPFFCYFHEKSRRIPGDFSEIKTFFEFSLIFSRNHAK